MTHGRRQRRRLIHAAAGLAVAWIVSTTSSTANGDIADRPLFLPGAVPPLNMLVMSRDHTLYYEAYNDASDLDGDGVVDVGYKPDEINYYGYFDSFKCYTYSSNRFEPVATTADKRCSGQWSGDFLNYLTTSRMDAMRKVLYGGTRVVDTASDTVLERSFIPQDAHSWGKEYHSPAHDGYDIADYTPFSIPTSGRHLFVSTTLRGETRPLLRVLTNESVRIWNWVSIERAVAGNQVVTGIDSDGNEVRQSRTPADYTVRVRVCVAGLDEPNCKVYPNGNAKPIGLLQEFGEDDKMLFGLLTGSYTNNLQGGVLRKNIGSLTDEIDADTGQFIATTPVGIIGTIDRLRIAQFTGADHSYYPGWSGAWITTGPISNGQVQDWGNPLAEMMYETLRYYAGLGSPTGSFSISASGNTDAELGLPVVSWNRPFEEFPVCSAAVKTVVSGIYPSYDTESVPGSAFSNFSGDSLGGLDASALGDLIWANEFGGPGQHFIGESGNDRDGAPTVKTVTSFGNIRGLAPEEPTKLGGYYSASVAYHGLRTDLLPAESGNQNVNSYVVALASPLPRIEIPVRGSTVTLVPFGKSVRDLGIDASRGSFQPTNTIVDFYVEQIVNTGPGNQDPSVNGGRPFGRFRINFEDVEQGADHDMDAIVLYEVSVNAQDEVVVKLTSEYAAGGIEQHIGYVISGTTADGTYLEVRDRDTSQSNAINYFLDTPPGVLPGQCGSASPPAACSTKLGFTAERTFTPSGASAGTLLESPLWYAAKWGGFRDANGNGIPDLQEEWDADGDGVPDNYFLVTNALTLGDQLRSAFDLILSLTSSASAVATNSTRLDTETLIYQARFRSDDWTGQLLAYRLQADGTLGAVQWDAATLIPNHALRTIYTRSGSVPGAGDGIPFEWDELDSSQQTALNRRPDGTADTLGEDRLNWIRGDRSLELQSGGPFRDRTSVLGDIVNSDPVFVGAQNFGYDALPAGTPGRDTYQTFRQSKLGTNGAALTPMVYVGANDGMLHGFDAVTGVERFAYVPSTLIPELNQLPALNYVQRHRYFVDGQLFVGDAYITRGGTPQWTSVLVGTTGAGGRTVYALDVTDPHNFDADDVLWEFTDEDLGYTIGQPTVARMADGTWVAVFGNGYGSDNHRAVLYIVDLEDGTLLRKIDTGYGSDAAPNGLATPALLPDGTRTINAIYAGDLQGNLWKFDVSGESYLDWHVAYSGAPLFVATDSTGQRQPITAPLEIGRNPEGGYMIYFGTGKFFSSDDNQIPANPMVQTFYGIWDRTTSPVGPITGGRSALQEQEIIFEGRPENSAFNVRVTTAHQIDWNSQRGWYLDLVSPVHGAEGERVIASPILRAGRVIFPTLIPSPNPCEFGGTSWLMEMDAVSGARLVRSPLDITEDGEIDDGDLVTIQLEDGSTIEVAVSGVQSREGIIRTPAVVTAGDVEFKLASGTSGNVEMLRERGLFQRARGSWRQLR